MSEILIFKQKHGDRYFDASTQELIEAACKRILLENHRVGYYHPGNRPECEWEDYDISVLPEKYQTNAKRELDQFKKQLKRYEADLRFYEKVKEIATTPNYTPEENSKWRFRNMGEFQSLLERRNGAEYECFDIIELEKVD